MATIKSYTDIEQSRKLAEILPIESADMYYHYNRGVVKDYHEDIPKYIELINHFGLLPEDVPCWSLAALLSVISNYRLSSEHNCHTCTVETSFGKETVAWFDNPVDVCYEMILKLDELELL